MFMPYFSSEKPDKMTVVASTTLVGYILILSACTVAVTVFCGGSLPPSVELETTNIVGIAVSIGIGLFCLFFRTATTINRRTGIISKRWGSILVLHRKEFPLSDYTSVHIIKKKKRRGSNSSGPARYTTVFYLELHGLNKCLRLKQVKAGWGVLRATPPGEKLKARLDAFLEF